MTLTDNWFTRKASEIIWSFIYDLVEGFLNDAFEMITDLVILDTDISRYFDINRYMVYFYIIAGLILAVKVTAEGIKQVSGNVLPTEYKSVGTLAGRAVWSGVFIYALPWSVSHVFLPLNNYTIKLIQHIGVDITPDSFDVNFLLELENMSVTILLSLLVLGVASLILGIIAGIRYVEIIIAQVMGCYMATTVIDGLDGISIWVRETISVVFTQVLHIFLLQFLISTFKSGSLFMIFISIGIVIVMIRGPKTLRKYIYSTGTGSSSIASLGTAGRAATYKAMLRK